MDDDAAAWQAAIAALPYGKEIRFVDRVIDSDGRRWVTTQKHYAPDQLIVAAHAALGGTVPGFALIEQAAQSALVLGMLIDAAPPTSARLGQIKARFLLPVVAPKHVDCRLVIRSATPTAIGFSAVLEEGESRFATVSGVCGLQRG